MYRWLIDWHKSMQPYIPLNWLYSFILIITELKLVSILTKVHSTPCGDAKNAASS